MVEKKSYPVPKGYEEEKRGDIISFENEGDFIKGTLDIVETGVGKYDSNVYRFTDFADKTQKSFFGSVVIDDLFKNVKTGSSIMLLYTGRVKTASGRKVKNFRLYVKK